MVVSVLKLGSVAALQKLCPEVEDQGVRDIISVYCEKLCFHDFFPLKFPLHSWYLDTLLICFSIYKLYHQTRFLIFFFSSVIL